MSVVTVAYCGPEWHPAGCTNCLVALRQVSVCQLCSCSIESLKAQCLFYCVPECSMCRGTSQQMLVLRNTSSAVRNVVKGTFFVYATCCNISKFCSCPKCMYVCMCVCGVLCVCVCVWCVCVCVCVVCVYVCVVCVRVVCECVCGVWCACVCMCVWCVCVCGWCVVCVCVCVRARAI